MKIHLFFLSIFFLYSSVSSCKKSETPPAIIETQKDTIKFEEFAMGVDLSYVNQVEDHGGVYKAGNEIKDPYQILKDKGANVVRLRLWHNPSWIKTVYDDNTTIYSGFEDVSKSIKRAKDLEMAVNLDFHYSDIWADPGKQNVPEAWKNITDIDILCDSVYNYTYTTLKELHSRNLLPEMVQIGNETNCGMMITETNTGFPDLNVCNGNWVNFGKVVIAGINAVRQIDTESGQTTKIALHVADPKNLDWWFTGLIQTGKVTDFDIIGFSYYHIWHTTVSFSELPSHVATIKSKFKKDIMILETAYPYTAENNDSYGNIYSVQTIIEGFPYTIAGQKEYMVQLTKNMMDAGLKGIMYWEPAWISSSMKDLWGTGSSWENCALFNFSGNVTEAANYLMPNNYQKK